MAYIEKDLIDKNWTNVVSINEDTPGLILQDIRLGGAVVRVLAPKSEFPNPYVPAALENRQAFYLSYHGGNGLDVRLKPDGQTVYPSRGLAVWHSLNEIKYLATGEWPIGGTWDLESAWGRYSDPDTISKGLGAWAAPDTNGGFDNVDIWVDLSVYNECEEDWDPWYDYFYNYAGSSGDFFGVLSGKTEFSFRSNPSTSVSHNSMGSRREVHDIRNSLVIRVTEEHGDYAVVDILFAPYEDVVAPGGGEALLVGQSYNITWTKEYTTDQPGGIIDLVDIYFDPGPGQPEGPIVFGASADSGSYNWTVGPEHVSDTAKIRIVYHNVNDATHTGSDESDDYFVVVEPPVAKFTDASFGTGLDYTGSPTCSASYDYDGDVNKDLFVGIGAAGSQSYVYKQTTLSGDGTPQFTEVFAFSPTASARGVVEGDYDNDGDLDLFISYGSESKLYRNDGGSFSDVGSSLGLSSLVKNSMAAVWGDYNNDGWIDLYVVKSVGPTEPPSYLSIWGQQHRLFRNDLGRGGGFVDVTAAAGLENYAVVGSVSASFVDIDRDGDLDLFVGNLQEPTTATGPGGIHSLLFVNQGNDTFWEEFEDRFPGDIFYATGHKWADVDNDNDFDLVVSTHQYKPAIYFNDGSGSFLEKPIKWLDAPEGHAGVEVFDQDLDGWCDIFLISKDSANSNRFFSGVETVAGVDFVENTSNVNMGNVSQAMGSAATDFTRDGDPDIFLGKPTASGEYFYRTDSQSGSLWIGRNYAKVRLESPYGASNRTGVGAIVEVSDGTNTWTQSVDGGSGRGGQTDRDLAFGLGDYSGTLTATVYWPSGLVQSGITLAVSNESSGETLNVIADASPPFTDVTAMSVIDPVSGTLTWTFSWDSYLACDESQDVLTFDQAGYPVPCWPGWTTVTPNTPGVSHAYVPKSTGGFHHEFIIPNVDCIRNCGFRFTVTSTVLGTSGTSAAQSKTVKFCPAQF